ncbi:hypothetical protein K505DRAFT_156602 [Melanomma pulvis-pyrius CBS 109.77]|uniref:Tyrosine-protein phosphatase SIW14 n=1 Tax=Melanomma pulvis-pyrius CBS 109.77 TaxID=1314802 RepID=A0A6A6XLL4_9PLEO|nr:hypothetical protein K505DRAFT_156602 [Melanomma pulvis-pyrius CBS 109.77]
MSITNGEPEAAEQSQHSLFKSVREYLLSLGLPAGYALSEHATHMHHEDVPDDVLTASGALAVQPLIHDSLRISHPILDPHYPDRLYPLFPPMNYGAVVAGAVYRSSYPKGENYEFLQSLKLKTILTLVDVKVSPEYSQFMDENGIQHFQVPIPANKGEVKVQACQMSKALRIVLDRTNHPLLIHCNKGKHRTGCVVGIIRRIQGYESSLIWDEYHVYADDKARFLDERCMEYFDLNTILWIARRYDWIQPNAEHIPCPISTMSVAKACV